MIIAVIIVVILVAAAAAVMLTQPKTEEAKPTNWLDRGFSMELFYNSGNTARQTGCQLMKTNLEALNPGKIHISVTGVEWSQYLALQRSGAMPFYFLGWAPDYADPNDYTVPFLKSQGTYLHTLGYSSPFLDAMVDQSASELNATLRAGQLHSIAQSVQKECLYIWMAQASNLNSMNAWITGFEFNPMYSNLYYYLLGKTAGIPANPIDTFTYGEIAGNPDYLDPARDYETAGGEVLQNVFETLVFYDGAHASEFIPMLATEVPTVDNGGISVDGMQYTFHIRDGVKFHDNSSLTAQDVKFSFERELRLNDPNGPAWILGEVMIPDYYDFGGAIYNSDGNLAKAPDVVGSPPALPIISDQAIFDNAMWVQDNHTLVINLTTNDPAFVSRLAFNSASIVSLTNTNAHSSNKPLSKTAFDYVNENPIGTGAYVFKEFIKNEYVALDRWDYYWRAPASIAHVLLKQIAVDSNRASGLLTGELDGAAIPRAIQQTLYGHANVVLTNSSTFNINFIGLNQNINTTGLDKTLNNIPSDFFRDLTVRKAFAHAFDFDTYNSQVMKGMAIQPTGVVPKGLLGYFDDIPAYEFNLTKAAAYLHVAKIKLEPQYANSILLDLILKD
jgi:peptide/nickel transport system substrate-binding protein